MEATQSHLAQVAKIHESSPATVLNWADWMTQNAYKGSPLRDGGRMVMSIGIALGIAIGAAVGTATHNIAKWVAFGAAVGVLMTVVLNRGVRKNA